MNALSTIRQKVLNGIVKNPLVWILLAAFVIAEYGNYQRGKELHRVCDLLGLDPAVIAPGTAADEIANICAGRDNPYEDSD